MIPKKIAQLRRAGVDLVPFEEPDVSGIAGTAFSALFTYDIARWLAARHPSAVEIDWDGYDAALLGPLLRVCIRSLTKTCWWRQTFLIWIGFARRSAGRARILRWLLSSDRSARSCSRRLRSSFAGISARGASTRTNGRLPGRRKLFYHDGPLIRRADVSLARELESPPIADRKAEPRGGREECSTSRARRPPCAIASCTVSLMAIRITCCAPILGRGVEVFVSGVPPEHRLPLRAYHAGMFFKNGVPIGYIECLTLFEHMEVGFNLYYTFREGETAWLYARLLRLFRQLLAVTCFAVDPYQLGHHNEEAIDSGAFWFYRKLGFRPANPQVARLLKREESKLRADPALSHAGRDAAASGRRLDDLRDCREHAAGDWDHFEVRRAAMALRAVAVSARDSTRQKTPRRNPRTFARCKAIRRCAAGC